MTKTIEWSGENRIIRKEPFGYEWPGAYLIGDEELEFFSQVVKGRSYFRHYGLNLKHMCDLFEEDFAKYVGSCHALSVISGTAALNVDMAAVVHIGAIKVLCDFSEWTCIIGKDGGMKLCNDLDGF